MKVLHVLNSRVYSGAEKVASQIIKEFEDEMEIAYCSPESDMVAQMLAEQQIRHIPVTNLLPRNLIKVIRAEKPDLIHAHDMRATLVAALCCGKIPLISHIHNNAFDARGLTLKSIGYLFGGYKAKHILWVSRSAYEGYFFHKLFAKKSSVLINIIDLKQVWNKRDQDENQYEYDMIFIGRLTYPKHPQRLMRMCALARERKPDIRLAVVGNGELDQETRALCAELGLENNVDFLGFQSNPMKMLYNSKCMILTSRWEGTPMCALEAMALGVPVVSTPTDGLLDLIDEGENGYLSGDDAVLAERIVQIANDPALRQKLSRNAAEKAIRINDMETYKKAVAALYARCIGAKKVE